MNQSEFEQFKEVIESNFVRNKLYAVDQLEKHDFLAALLNYLVLTKDYNGLEKYLQNGIIDAFGKISFLPTNFLMEVKGLNNQEANDFMYTNFMQDGYLYHVTKTSYLDSIFQQGLVSLNKKFNEDMYKKCLRVNRSFRSFIKRNNIKSRDDLIDIPDYDRLYKGRFKSIYLSTNLAHSLDLYGNASEIFDRFLDKILSVIKLEEKSKYLSKTQLRDKIINQMHHLSYQDNELQTLLDFYDQCYEFVDQSIMKNKTIIMVPNDNIQDTTKNRMIYHTYNRLIKDKVNFVYHYQKCYDIECPHDIAPENLIAITIEEDHSLKVHRKVK